MLTRGDAANRDLLRRLEAIKCRHGDDDGFPASITIAVISMTGEPPARARLA